MKHVSASKAALLFLLVFASMLMAQTSTSPAPERDESRLRKISVGDRHYAGPHSWEGVIKVTDDSVLYENGTIRAAPSGLPEGVTFEGNRKDITLRNLKFEGVGDGINLGNNQHVNNLTVDDCHFTSCRTPDADSEDHLLGSRGNAFFGWRGQHWILRDSTFKTKCKDDCSTEDKSFSVQYALRLGYVSKLNVSNCTFENRNGKATMWLMFVKDALFDDSTFNWGRITVGSRPGDIGDIPKGECNNIVFRNCTFNFGVSDEWPCSFNIYPGSSNIHFVNCTFKTKGDWWLEVDSRDVTNVHWDSRCTWNGKPITEYLGVRSTMSVEEMAGKNVTPSEHDAAPKSADASHATARQGAAGGASSSTAAYIGR